MHPKQMEPSMKYPSLQLYTNAIVHDFTPVLQDRHTPYEFMYRPYWQVVHDVEFVHIEHPKGHDKHVLLLGYR